MADRIKNYQQEADQITTLKEIRTDLGVTPSSYTPDATVVTKDRVVTFAQAEEELVVLSDIEKGVKQQVVKGDIADKRITNIEKLLQGNLYDYQTDNTSAYTKTVPSGAMPYAGLEKVGGKTIVMNQLVQNGNFADSTGWAGQQATLSVSDGVATITGTSNCARLRRTSMPTITAGHKYFISCECQKNMALGSACRAMNMRLGSFTFGVLWTANVNTWERFSVVFTTTTGNDSSDYFYLADANADFASGYEAKVRNVFIIDLTLMFGAGNEPSTVAEFESMFPADYYAYNEGELLSAGVTEVVSKDSNNATLQTIPIPTAIRNLEGYGLSVGNLKNYIDFERKVYVQKVAKLTLAIANMNNSENYPGWSNIVVRNTVGANKTGGIPASMWQLKNGYACNLNTTDNNSILFLDKLYYNLTQTEWKTQYPNLVAEFCVPLAEPIETDISEYITDDNLIEVEAGGTLTFPNSNGTDYQIPVPSEEEYMIDLQSAL